MGQPIPESLTGRANRLASEAAVATEVVLQYLADEVTNGRLTADQEDRLIAYGVEAGLKALSSIATSLAVLAGRSPR